MIKAIIYDFDDTISDSELLHLKAWEMALHEYNIDTTGFKEWKLKNLLGKRSQENARLIVENYKLDIDSEKFYERKTEILSQILETESQLMPGVIESIKLFQDLNLKLAVASGSAKSVIEIVLKKFDLLKFFDVIVSSLDVVNGKPHPETFEIACKRLELSPSECLVIEDTLVGVEAALAAGCKCIAVPNRHVQNDDFSKADLILPTLKK